MTQRMRDTYPRDPAKFFKNEYEDWEIAIAMQRLQEGAISFMSLLHMWAAVRTARSCVLTNSSISLAKQYR